MDLDAKLAADTLRKMADFKQMLAFPHDTGKIINACADLIESLAAELEQVTQECDSLSAMLTSEQSAAETHKRKLDAALADMKAIAEKTGCCHCCAHQPDMNPDGSCDRFDPQNPGECWEWRETYEKDRILRADRADRAGTF